jgi:hypothetical protein
MTSFQHQYLAIKQRYDRLSLFSDISGNVYKDLSGSSYTSPGKNSAVTNITTYDSTLNGINTELQDLMDKASTNLAAAVPSANKERYIQREYPDSTTETRELFGGFFPTMHPNTLPFILSGGIFMAALAIFMIFETLGFRGNVIIPPALTSAGLGPIPFYKNSLVLGGVSVVLLIATITFAVKYFTK